MKLKMKRVKKRSAALRHIVREFERTVNRLVGAGMDRDEAMRKSTDLFAALFGLDRKTSGKVMSIVGQQRKSA